MGSVLPTALARPAASANNRTGDCTRSRAGEAKDMPYTFRAKMPKHGQVMGGTHVAPGRPQASAARPASQHKGAHYTHVGACTKTVTVLSASVKRPRSVGRRATKVAAAREVVGGGTAAYTVASWSVGTATCGCRWVGWAGSGRGGGKGQRQGAGSGACQACAGGWQKQQAASPARSRRPGWRRRTGPSARECTGGR